MKVLVSGATGFLGSHIVQGLTSLGHEVLALKRSTSDQWRIEGQRHRIRLINLDKEDLASVVSKNGPVEIFVHAATCYGRRGESLTDIVGTNLLFPLQLMELAINCGAKHFFNFDSFFGKFRTYAHLWEYNTSKTQFLSWGKALAYKSGVKFTNLRIEHMYGPKDSEEKILIHLICSCLKNIPKIDLTSGEQKRDFIYVDDVVAAFLCLLDKHKQLDVFTEFEIGTGRSVPLKVFFETIRDLIDSQTILDFGAISYRDDEIMDSKANLDPLSKFGWKPKYDYYEGLKKTIEDCLKRFF